MLPGNCAISHHVHEDVKRWVLLPSSCIQGCNLPSGAHDILGIDRGQIGEAPVLHARLGAEANDPDRQLLPEATPVVHEVEPAQLMPISQGTDTSNVSPGTGTSLKLRLNLHVQLSSAMH